MDWLKIALEKFFGFFAAMIPGAAALMLLGIHHPTWATAFRDINYLGYNTKVSLVLAAAFVAGWTVAMSWRFGCGFIEEVLAALFPNWLRSNDAQYPPWRTKNWRALVKSYLGAAAPDDVEIVPDELVKIQFQTASYIADPQQRALEITRISQAKAKADLVDLHWRGWWDTLHHQTLLDMDAVTQVITTIEGNFQAASAVLFCALFSTPALRHWWIILPSAFWVGKRPLRAFVLLGQFRDPWASFRKQMTYLRSVLPGAKATTDASGSD